MKKRALTRIIRSKHVDSVTYFKNKFVALAPSELKFALHLCKGLTPVEAQKEMHWARGTIYNILQRIYSKTGTRTPIEIVLWMIKSKFFKVEDIKVGYEIDKCDCSYAKMYKNILIEQGLNCINTQLT